MSAGVMLIITKVWKHTHTHTYTYICTLELVTVSNVEMSIDLCPSPRATNPRN